MPRPKLPTDEAASRSVTLRLTPPDFTRLAKLVELDNATAEAAGSSASATTTTVIRSLVSREARAKGVLLPGEVPAPAPPSMPSTITSSTPSTPATSAHLGPNHPVTPPDPLPPERARTPGEVAQLAAVVGGALAAMANDLGRVPAPALVRCLSTMGLDRRDVFDGIEVWRDHGNGPVQLVKLDSPGTYPPAEQQVALPGAVPGTFTLTIAVVRPLNLATLPGLQAPSAPSSTTPTASSSPRAPSTSTHKTSSKAPASPVRVSSKAPKGSADAGDDDDQEGEGAELTRRAIEWCDAYGRGGFVALSELTGWEQSHVRKVLQAGRPVPADHRPAVAKALRRSASVVRTERSGKRG